MLGPAGHPALLRRTGIVALAMLLLAGLLLFAARASAQTFPELTGRVVDGANVIPPDEEARIDQKLAALEQQSHRQLVVVTLADLQGYDIADYGYQLGRHWGIGDKEHNDGALLIIAPNDRKVRIEVGYGLEGTITDGLSTLIIQQQIIPRIKAGDMPGGIEAGADAIIKQLSLPPDQAQKIAANAKPATKEKFPAGMFVWLLIFGLFFVLPMIRRARGRNYQSSGLGPIVLWSVLDGLSSGRSGGGGSDWGGGGGGFSGGGGSFGGGGASGGW
ncbi:MAG: TPM domain-containing protein [Novosphingobium sp.]